MGVEVMGGLSPDEARRLTEEVKADAAALWAKLLRLYEGGAHLALGYGSWAGYARREFGQSRTRAYELLAAARVDRLLLESGVPDRASSEAVANELVPVMREGPERVGEVWGEVVELHGPKPTATEARAVVRARGSVKADRAVPSWAVRADALAVELRNLTRSRPAERAEHAVTAAGLLADVQADLDRLVAGEVR